MQIQCPNCKEWIESTDELCPFCHEAVNHAQNTTWLPHSFFVKKRIKRVVLIAILFLCIWGIVSFIKYIKGNDEPEKLIGIGAPYYTFIEGCLPPYDSVEIPGNADDATILKMEEELYLAHLKHTDCTVPQANGVSWATRIGSGWLSKANEERMVNNPRYTQVLKSQKDDRSFMKDHQGCHGFPLSTRYDGMRLYVRSPKKGHIEMAFMSNAALIGTGGDPYPKPDHYMERKDKLGVASYTVHTPDRPVAFIHGSSSVAGNYEEVPHLLGVEVEPVHKSPVLYGVDREHYAQGVLKQLKETPYYSFYSGEALYLQMQKSHDFRVVLVVQRGKQRFIIYRVYALSHDIATDAQFLMKLVNSKDWRHADTMPSLSRMDGCR